MTLDRAIQIANKYHSDPNYGDIPDNEIDDAHLKLLEFALTVRAEVISEPCHERK